MSTAASASAPPLDPTRAADRFRQAVAQTLLDFAAAFPRDRSIEPAKLQDVWERALSGVAIASIRPAADTILQRGGKYAPSPGDFRGECLKLAELRGITARPDLPPQRDRFSAFPESDCPVCGRAAEIAAEWTADARKWDPVARAWQSDGIQYRVTYPPECACWAHDRPRRAVLRAVEWLTKGQQWAARQMLEERTPPAMDPALREEIAAIRLVAQTKQALKPADPWLTDERRAQIPPPLALLRPTDAAPPLDESDAVAQ